MTSPTRRIRLHAETTEDGRGLARLRDDLEKAAKGTESLGSSMGDTENDARSLEAQIARTRKEIRNLGEEYERTGDASLFGDLNKQRRLLVNLERIKKEAAADGDSAGVEFGSSAGKAANRSFGSMLDFGGSGIRPRNAAIGAIVAAAALAAPTIGAMIAGAVTGAVGLGGIAGGIAAAAKSPAVKQAASNFASNVSSAFSQYGDQFVEPLVNAFQILEQGFHDLNLERAFEKTAAYVDDIARGLAGFGRNMMPGIERTLDVAGPALEILGRELPRLGTAFGDMFADMAEGKGTLQGFLFLIGSVKFTLEAVGATIRWLSDRFYDWMVFLKNLSGAMEDVPLNPFRDDWAKANDAIEGFIESADVAGQAMNYVGRETQTTAGSAKNASDAIGILNQKMYDQQTAALGLVDAQLAYKADLLRLNEAVKDHGTSLDTSTQAGVENQQMIHRLIGDLRLEYDQAIKAAEGNEEKEERARVAYNKQVADLQKVLLNLGFEKRQIADIIAAYKNIPTRIYTQIIQDYQTRGVPAGEHSGPRSAEGRQHGGPVLAGVPYMINERARETVTFPASGTVHPASLTPMAGNARPFAPTITDPLLQMAFNLFVKEVGDRGGTLAVIGVRG